MTRSRFPRSLIALACAGLVATSLWAPPVAADTPTPEPTSSPASEPPSPPSPDPSPTPVPEPSPEPSLSPSLATGPAEATPAATPSPNTAALTDDGAVDDYIVVVRNGAYIDSLKNKVEQLGGQPDKELRGAVDGFTATLTEQDVEQLEADPNVKYVERDEFVQVNAAVSGYVDCDASSMGARDDGAVGPINLGFTVDWFGTSYSSIYINNNGGFVFNDGGGEFTAYRGIDLQSAPRPYVLPLFTDIDTRYTDGVVTFGPLDDSDPTAGFCINWIDVGEYGGTEEDYSFQVILTNLGDGEIDLEFNYDRVSVPTNNFNNSFEVGYTAGDQTNFRVLADSTDPASTVATDLVSQKFPASCTIAGRYIYEIRSSGNPTPAPTPTTAPTAPDPTPSPTQSPATWGLDRIDQATLPLNNTYVTPTVGTATDNYGQGVVVYVVDTGVRYTHQEFGNRARKNELVKGIDEVSNDNDPNDCNGHGTHVAGTIGGYTYGVAKQVEIVGVRVLGCEGSGWSSDVIAGLNAIPSFHAAHYGSSHRAVVNMSLGGGKSAALNAAVSALTAAHIPVVVAAGNDGEDAADYSPASEPTAITVGASTSSDVRSYFSNYGPLVDIFAPGSNITASWHTSNSAVYTISGTSMASPHVAGAVALYLGINSTSATSPTTSQVSEAITGYAATGRLDLNNPGTTTTNKLLNVSAYVAPFSYATNFSSRAAHMESSPEEDALSTRVPRQLIEARCTARDSGGSPAPPVSTPPPSSGGGSGGGGGGSGGGSSPGASKPGGGGGGLNAVTTIIPATSGAVGSTIALAGWGLETTRDVKFNDVSARFTVVSGRQVDVVVPDIPPGVYVIHAVLAPEVGRASFWDGFTVQARSSAAPGAPSATAPPTSTSPAGATDEAADFMLFTGTSSSLTKATRNKLTRIARQFTDTDAQATIVAYTDAKGTTSSTRRANSRAQAMQDYLDDAGFNGSTRVVIEPGSSQLQSRGVLIYVAPGGGGTAAVKPDEVRSLIVRLRKGRSISVDGKVRGANNVTGTLGNSLTVGAYLGLRMYRIDFGAPVPSAVAERIANQIARNPGIEFAEPDSVVTTQVSIAS